MFKEQGFTYLFLAVLFNETWDPGGFEMLICFNIEGKVDLRRHECFLPSFY